VDQRGHLALRQAQGAGPLAIEDPRDTAQLQEVVAGPHRAELVRTPLARSVGDLLGVGILDAAARFRPLGVVRGPDASIHQSAWALAQHRLQLVGAQGDPASASSPHRHLAGDGVHEPLLSVAQLVGVERQREQPHTAIDVISHAAGRNDPIGRERRRDAADRKAVTLVDVGHRQCRVDDPRQRRHVGELLERAVVA
jgi:hypothetical protein